MLHNLLPMYSNRISIIRLGIKTYLLLAVLSVLSSKAIAQRRNEVDKTTHAKNVILLIGDGMGLTQVSVGLYSNMNKLSIEQFKVIGLHKSYSEDNLITDSAAGAVAFACGIKTYNGAIGVNKDTASVPNLVEEAEHKGKATGLVVTSILQHATPAAFVAHQKHRDMYEAITLDFLKLDIDFLVGGGKKYFNQRKSDQRNVIAEMEQKGYKVLDLSQGVQFREVSDRPAGKKLIFTTEDSPLKVSEGRNYLPEATKLAINCLENDSKEGFFLMVEGSQIDWGGHDNDADYVIKEMLDFDKSIAKALEFAMKDGNTLVIVTADHETGGLSINEGSKMGQLVTAFTTKHHTGTLIPVYAYGPGAENFGGIYENTAIYQKIRAAFGW